MKKIVLTVTAVILAIAILSGGLIGYVYHDFSVKGLDSANFDYTSYFETEGTFVLEGINAEYTDGEIKSSSGKTEFNGVTVTASICETEGTGTLVLRVHQKPSVYNPFEAEYIGFAQRVIKENGNESYVFPGHFGTDKNGRKLYFQNGSSGVEYEGENDVKTYEYWIRYSDGDYLKADDIEDAFPITVNLKGHKSAYTRTSLF